MIKNKLSFTLLLLFVFSCSSQEKSLLQKKIYLNQEQPSQININPKELETSNALENTLSKEAPKYTDSIKNETISINKPLYPSSKTLESDALKQVKNSSNSNKIDVPLWWKPKVSATFDWVLSEQVKPYTLDTQIIDVDAFETSTALVSNLKNQGKKVIAYISVGTIENNRPDSNLLPKEIIGNTYTEWPNEKWLDIRQIDKIKPWITSRFNMIKEKGFDAIEPDNLDGYDKKGIGFDLNSNDVKKFCDFIIQEAHNRGLGIGQKNLSELSNEFSDKFDWALTEDAFEQGWQDEMKYFIQKNKPVFSTEYTDKMNEQDFLSKVCPKAKSISFTAILKNRNLDKWTKFCN